MRWLAFFVVACVQENGLRPRKWLAPKKMACVQENDLLLLLYFTLASRQAKKCKIMQTKKLPKRRNQENTGQIVLHMENVQGYAPLVRNFLLVDFATQNLSSNSGL